MRPDTCCATQHRKGCRPARPLCRWMRARNPKMAVCRCDYLHYPHRAGSCAGKEAPLAILQSRSYQEAV